MRVLHTIPSLQVGGAEAVLFYSLERWSSIYQHTEAEVVTLMGGGRFYESALEKGMSVRTLGLRRPLDLLKIIPIIRLSRLIKSGNYDLLHCHLTYADFSTVLAARLAGFKGPIVYTEHSIWNRRRVFWFRLFDMVLSRQFNLTVAVSDQAKRAFCDWNRLPDDRVQTIYNGIPESDFRAGTRIGRRIIHVGRFVEAKDHATLLRAAYLLLEAGIDFELQLVGYGPLQPNIEAQIAELGLGNVVSIVDSANIPHLLSQADIFTLSSRWEGLPMALLEAMASELPCVVTDVGGMPDAVRHGRDGLVVPPANPARLAEAWTVLLSDGQKRSTMGTNARNHIESRFSMTAMAARLEAAYQSLVGGPDGR